MKRHWRLGVLLAVSMALLLAGGVALAQAVLGVGVEPDCFVCTPRADWPPSEGQFVELTLSGYETTDALCGRLMMDGTLWEEGCWYPYELSDPPCSVLLAVRCEDMEVQMEENCSVNDRAAGSFRISQPPAVYGTWTWRLWQEDEGENVVAGPVKGTFRFAKVCEVEFVPEAGSVLLLGSGLAGLAGYATLRWRGRE
jgi:hypothetical protein